MSYKIKMTKSAMKDFYKIKASPYHSIVKELLEIIEEDPLAYPPKFEYLKGNMEGFISRRINKKHRLIYKIQNSEIIIYAMWTHYETF